MQEFSFNVAANGTVQQTVNIVKEGLTGEELLNGLKSGLYITTIGEGKQILETENWSVVANVVYNEVLDDMEYSDFSLD